MYTGISDTGEIDMENDDTIASSAEIYAAFAEILNDMENLYRSTDVEEDE